MIYIFHHLMYNFSLDIQHGILNMSSDDLKSVAVTGASGFIGTHLVKFLLAQGFNVRVLINQTDIPLNVDKYNGSLQDRECLQKFLQGVDLLFHLAAALGNRCLSREDFYAINRDGTANIMQTALKMGIKKVVCYSSAGVYGKSSGLVPLREDHHLNPKDIYELSKKAGEDVVRDFSGQLNFNIIRPGWVYGPSDGRTFKLIRQIHKGPFFIAGKGLIKHSPIYVGDLIAASWQIALHGESGQVFNVGGPAMSVREMVQVIYKVLAKGGHASHLPLWLTIPAAWIMEKLYALAGKEGPLTTAKLAFFLRGKPLDSTKISHSLGVTFPTDFEEGISLAIEWYKEEGWL